MAASLPRPRSEAQRAAARRNGARSRGPITAEGRARASRNALRHGLCAATHLVARGEDPAELEALLAELRAEHGPRSASEDVLVHRLAVVVWKLARCDRLEAALMDSRPRPPAGRVYAEPGLPAFLSRPAELGVLLRHEAQLGRELHRLLRALADRPRRLARPALAEPAEEAGPTCAPVAADLRNEPEREPAAAPFGPAPAAGDPEPAAAGTGTGPATPAPDPTATDPPRPAESAAPAAEPPADSLAAERALLARAAERPALATSLLEHLLEEGELRRFQRLAARLRAGGFAIAPVDRPARLG
jgi:hypothetical protein